MGLFKRISDIISANLNEMAESYEDPEKMLKQAIREMETSIGDATKDTAKALASQKLMTRELERNESEARDWQQRAEKAVASSDESLARKALARKQEHDKLAAALRDQLATAKETTDSLRRQLDGMSAKLAEAKRSLASLSARQKAADYRKKMTTSKLDASTELSDNAFAKFDRLREKVEQAEAEAEALAELSPSAGEALKADSASGKDSLDIESQLEELKRKMQK
jgi:phage shock protein A